jgi:hypothetical protein
MRIKESYQTEAYISEGGYYVIRQPDPLGGQDAVILLAPDQIRVILKDMQESLEIENEWWAPVIQEAP